MLGLFQNEEEAANSPIIAGRMPLPGYIRYQDRNGDGIISNATRYGVYRKECSSDP
ncbi:hypothetical protein NXX38_16895 [Bacteroides sp. BFG-637]|nr:hypothetical protein [Bacteroides sp. BFG-637]MCS3313480.1 hypothetical protein [Bacteroides sp. BFG-637]